MHGIMTRLAICADESQAWVPACAGTTEEFIRVCFDRYSTVRAIPSPYPLALSLRPVVDLRYTSELSLSAADQRQSPSIVSTAAYCASGAIFPAAA